MLQGAPVFLLDVDSQKLERLGFYATRRVQAESAERAGVLASRMVLDEVREARTRNPPDLPIQVVVEEVAEISWFEMTRKGPGCGFTSYPDEAS
jgi:hypothetical protein